MTGKHLRYLTNLSATFLSQAVSALSILLLTPVLVRNLGTEQFSLYGVLLNIIIFSSVFDFGLNIGLLRRLIHEKSQSEALISSLFFFFLFLFVISVPVFFVLYESEILNTGSNYFYHAFFTAILITQNILALLFDVIIQTANKIFVGKIIRISKLVIEFTALYFFCRQGSVTLLLLVSAVVNFLYIFILFYYSKKEVNYKISFAYSKWKLLVSHLRYSFWYFQAAIAGVLAFNAQIIMISSLLDSISVAKYILVSRFFDVIRIGLTNFTIVLFPMLATIQSEGNWSLLKEMYLTILKRMGILAIVLLAALIGIGQTVFVFWSKQGGQDIRLLFKLFAVFIMMIVIDNVSAVFLSALRLNKIQVIVAMGQGVVALVLGYLLIRPFGIAGIALGSIIALLATNFIFNPVYLIRQINQHISTKRDGSNL